MTNNLQVLNGLKISKSDTNKLWTAIEKFNTNLGAKESDKSITKHESSFRRSKRTRLSTFRENQNDTLPLNTSFVDFLGDSFNQKPSMLSLESNADNLIKLSKYQVKYSFGVNNK
jgi:hypothetical protein